MELFAVGLNHHSAPLAVRERLAFAAEGLPLALAALRADLAAQGLAEVVVLSTCNRTELYCVGYPAQPSAGTPANPSPSFNHSTTPHSNLPQVVLAWWCKYKGVNQAELAPHVYLLPQLEAVRHAFTVACGLDSMVLGEAQILGQLKTAVQHARVAKAMGVLLNQLFQHTFAVAKAVRSQTEIGLHTVSMASAAVKLARRIFGPLQGRQILMIGAGEMIQLCATHFAAQQPAGLHIANRSLQRAQVVAKPLGGEALALAQVPQALAQADVVVSCTASTLPIIGLGLVESICKKRKHAPMCIIDLAVPRDVEPEVGRLDDVFLYTVDDLASLVQEGRELRQAAVSQAQVLLENQVQAFVRWQASRRVVPAIQALSAHTHSIQERELAYAKKLLAKGMPAEEVLSTLARRMAAKFTHPPLQRLHQANQAEQDELLRWWPQLFTPPNLDPE